MSYGKPASAKSHPSVILKPADILVVPNDKLVFSLSPEGGQEGKAKAHLVIHNPTEDSVVYKFKTNAGNKVTVGVHPAAGHVHSGEHVDINVFVDYDTEEDIRNLRLLVVTATAPEDEYNPKTVWEGIKTEHQKITKVSCIVNNTGPNSQHDSCIIDRVPSPGAQFPPEPSSGVEAQHSAGQTPVKEQKADSGQLQSQSLQPKYSQLVDNQSQQSSPKTQMAQGLQLDQRQKQQQLPRNAAQPWQDPRRHGTLNVGFGGNKNRPRSPAIDQYRNFVYQGKAPTSYFVDVSSVAAPDIKQIESSSGFFGIDRKNMIQAALFTAAGVAATKLFFDE